jgi:uncharacterized membrane protein (UPF0127 family)
LRKVWLVLAVLMACGCLALAAVPAEGEEISEYGNPFVWVTVGPVKVKAEAVATPEKLYRGLGYRQELPDGRGMLFFLPATAVQNFCMRGMAFPLDILWIVDGKVVGMEAKVAPTFPGTLRSPRPVNYVLEVPGGFAERYGIKVGDPVSW